MKNMITFGDETGTSDFYVVHDTLIKYLGDENIYVNWNYNDYIHTIESIYEPFDYPSGIYEDNKNDHLVFQIIYDE